MTRIGWKPKSDDPRIASVRFRCLTPMAALAGDGLDIELFDPQAARSYDLVIFSKLYEPRDQELARSLAQRGCRTMLDLSDNHFYNPFNLPAYHAAGRNLRAMVRLVDLVTCCGTELARVVSAEAEPRRAPLAVGDAVEAFALPEIARDGVFRFLWFGSHGSPNAPAGMEDLLRIRAPLNAACAAQACELVVVSNNADKFAKLRGEIGAPTRYVEWDAAAFARELARADLVVVPITLNPFTLCKSNNRAATALWHGAPVAADRIPAYDELAPFAVLDDWDGAFAAALAGDLRQRTEAGRAYVQAHFNTRAISAAWRGAIEAALAAPIDTGARA